MAQEPPTRARESSPGREGEARVGAKIPVELVLALAASLGLLATIWAVDYLPTHDGPQHIYLAHVSNHYADPGAPYQTFYEPGRPLTALGFELLFAPLESVLPWRVALKLVLSAITLVWAWGAWSFIGALHPKRNVLGLLAFAAALQWSLYMGFFSYVLATGVGFFVLSTAARAWPWTWKRRAALAALLLVEAVFHVFAAQVTGLLLVLMVLFRSERGSRGRSMAWLAAMGLPAIAIALYTAGLLTDPSRAGLFRSMGSVWPTWLQRLTRLADLFTPGPAWKTWPFVLLAIAGCIDGARRLKARARGAWDAPLALGAAVLFAMALLLPFHVRGRWEFLSPRFTPVAIVIGISLIGVERLRAPGRDRWIAAMLTLFVGASLWWSKGLHERVREACRDALSGLESPVVRDGIRLPIVMDTKCGARDLLAANHLKFVEPALNVGALYAVQQGGVVPYVFALQPEIHPFVVSDDGLGRFPPIPNRKELWVRAMTTPSEQERSDTLQTLVSYGAGVQDVIFVGRSEDTKALLARGYVPDALHGGTMVARFVGCSARLEVQLEEPGGAIVVELRWAPSTRLAWGGRFRPRERTGSIPLPGAPCGPVRLKAVQDRDETGSWTSGDGKCRGSDEGGELAVDLTQGARVVCEMFR